MRYLLADLRDEISWNGPFVTPETRAGRAIIRLYLRKHPEAIAPAGFEFVYLRAGRDSTVILDRKWPLDFWIDPPRSRVNVRGSLKCGCRGPIGKLYETQERCYAAARRFRFTADERRTAETLLAAAAEKEAAEKKRRDADLRRRIQIAEIRGPFVGARESAARKRRNLLSLGIPS